MLCVARMQEIPRVEYVARVQASKYTKSDPDTGVCETLAMDNTW